MKQYIIKYRGHKLTKTVRKSGKTTLVYGIVLQKFKTEEEADANLDNFLAIAIDINSKEIYNKNSNTSTENKS